MRGDESAGLKLDNAENILLHYAAIIESSEDAIIGKTLDGIITSWNPGAKRIFGYSAEEVIGRPMLILFPPDRVSEEAGILKRISNGERVDHFETVRLRKDGTSIDVSVSISPIVDSNGVIIGASKIARDITQRKNTEEKLRRTEYRYKSTLDEMLEGCQIIDSDFRYVYINEAAAKQGKRTIDELLGHSMIEMYPGVESSQMFTALRRCMVDRKPHQMESEFFFPDGTTGWYSLSMAPVPEGIFVLSLDITAQKQLVKELNYRQETLEQLVKSRTSLLEDANKELEAFSYSVSHDLRAPLRHIDGFVELLNKSAAASLDETSLKYLEIISSSARTMGMLIDQLLAFSRQNKMEMKNTRFPVQVMVDDIVRSLEEEAQDRMIDWDIDAAVEVEADANMLRLVFVNLLSNAVKYTSTKEKPKIEVGNFERGDEMVFYVRDNGVGFDMKYVDKLFGVFQRLHRKEEFEGIGIGLANVRRIVHRHGGKTWAEGKVNEGATFYFSLPTAPMEQKS
jgi:PAS domain S-box-containing protein